MRLKDIERIMRENKKYTDMLEEYERTGEFPLEKIRRSFTLKRANVNKLKRSSKEKGEIMSDLLDGLIDKNL